jgi:hypothetical protein
VRTLFAGTSVCSTVNCATALPIVLMLTATIPMAAAIPMTNCVMLFGKIASIHECDGGRVANRAAQCL